MQVYNETGIPIVFDYLHHTFCSGGLTEEQALNLAISTWPSGITPVAHFASSKRAFEDKTSKAEAHADLVYQPIKVYGHAIDLMMEAKAKEKAVLQYQKEFAMVMH
jgi:UV DNA damage endonuclease